MSTITRKKIIHSLTILFSMVMILIGYFFAQAESKSELLRRAWSAKQIILDNEDVTDKFKRRVFSFMSLDSNIAVVPTHTDLPSPYPLVFGSWCLDDEKKLVIQGTPQEIFDGQYLIKVLSNHQPRRIILTSNKVDLLLEELYFSTDKPFINDQ